MKVNHDLLMAKKILFDTLTWSLPFLDLEKINKIITILRDITKDLKNE